MESLESNIDAGQLEFMNSDNCRVPYPNSVSYEEHEKIRLRIETFLFKKGILDEKRIAEIHKKHMTPEEWEMIKDTPERYWPELFAARMTPEERKKLDQSNYTAFILRDPEAYQRYIVSTSVWTGVAEKLYYQNNGRLPTPEEEYKIIYECSGPWHRCFFIFAELVAGLRVVYNWADDFFKQWENFKISQSENFQARI